jgi:L-alanine-DL-glutamate epimerase-like enolase superfamily enzyme
MKITAVETTVVSMPMRINGPAPKMGGIPRTSMEILLVRVDTDKGITGWGEAFGHRAIPTTRTAIDVLIAPLCIGRDPAAIGEISLDIQHALHGGGRNGPVIYGLSGIDIALWDIAGKVAGLPLYRLLGGSERADVPAYASLLRYGEPAAVTHYAEEALERGYRHVKVHEIEAVNVKAARDALGSDVPLMVDCNCLWDAEEAVRRARSFAPYNPHWIEEAIWPPEDGHAMAKLRREGGVPTAAGENYMFDDFQRLCELEALDFLQPSITKVGGVTGMRAVFELGAAHNVQVVPHSAYFGPGLLASTHVIASYSGEIPVERYYADFDDTPLHDAINPKNGRMLVPQSPGLGLDPDLDVVERMRVDA